jgi:hypothetical protein
MPEVWLAVLRIGKDYLQCGYTCCKSIGRKFQLAEGISPSYNNTREPIE